ncbi:MAG: hypothetical protein ABEJ07_05510 [Candidatus Nanohaloarchaea archaeon]
METGFTGRNMYWLVGLASAVAVAAVFFLASSDGEIAGDADIGAIQDVRVEANGTVTFSFNASKIEEMHYTTLRNGRPVIWGGLDLERAIPFPRMKVQTLPPYWEWQRDARRVRGVFRVNASGLRPGNYTVTVEAWNHEPGDHSHSGGDSENFTLAVVD